MTTMTASVTKWAKTRRFRKNVRQRAARALAKVRHRQLELALQQRYVESARYARWAGQIRRWLSGRVV